MFHRARDASKVALVHLVARLRRGGFRLLDAQFVTPHLAALGAVEIPRDEYRRLLSAAIEATADFAAWAPSEPMAGARALELALGGSAASLLPASRGEG
jgi:leucyl/phenylalanyl-tRNA--protein transferase